MKNIYHIMKNHPHSGNVSLKKKKKKKSILMVTNIYSKHASIAGPTALCF